MQHRVPRKVDVLREAAPQMRRLVGGRVAVPDGVRVITPVRILAMTILAEGAPLAFAAANVVLHEDKVAFLEALTPRELATRLGDIADIFVTHDHGALG